eukprot:TRINITY_DN95992_c0_g1_i1.p1 TRINITY_DN95992_c0_g1~~TRINITY_DN95992_c0_g1_i1.p1  ORF type:complete len:496 (-),score=48.23 TRINITY_DN95992_c0_g1_i1:160-1470(-)
MGVVASKSAAECCCDSRADVSVTTIEPTAEEEPTSSKIQYLSEEMERNLSRQLEEQERQEEQLVSPSGVNPVVVEEWRGVELLEAPDAESKEEGLPAAGGTAAATPASGGQDVSRAASPPLQTTNPVNEIAETTGNSGKSEISTIIIVLGLLSIIIHLVALPVFFLIGDSMTGQIIQAIAIACGLLLGLASLMRRVGTASFIAVAILGAGCAAGSIVCFSIGGTKGLKLLQRPMLWDCEIPDIKAAVEGSAAPASFVCRDGFVDLTKQVTGKVNGKDVKMAPVYIDEFHAKQAPSLLAVAEGDQEIDLAPCETLTHSHAHEHGEQPADPAHAHDHVHRRMCGFATNVRQSTAWSDIAGELRSRLHTAHLRTGGDAFEVDSVPVVDLVETSEVSRQMTTFFIVGSALYLLLIPCFLFCCARSIAMVTKRRDILASKS